MNVIHGKLSTYKEDRCRCRPCKDANARQKRSEAARRRERNRPDYVAPPTRDVPAIYMAARIQVAPNGCWPWRGPHNPQGYGMWRGQLHRGQLAHRVVYERLVGPIPDALSLDHMCHNADLTCRGGPRCLHRRCVNPAHLEPTTQAINTKRGRCTKTHCKRGHEFTPANTRWLKDGGRRCRPCGNAHQRERHAVSRAKCPKPQPEEKE